MTSQTTQQALKNWSDLKFGMFIHFGVYSMLAGEWQGEKVKGLGEWIQCMKRIPSKEYGQVAKSFNPTQWDPEAIAKLASEAGMKYLVITSKHHDGFALFDSKASDYNIVNSVYGKDLLAPLVEACRRHGVMPGFYYSQDLDWHDPDGTLNEWDFDPQKKDFSAYLERKVKPQLTELLTRYGEIGVIWFDTPKQLTLEQSKELADLVHSLQPSCVFNSRLGNGFGDFESLGDNQVPGARCETFAETAGTINDTWGYKNVDQDWKTPREVAVQLCELASKGVNYLLNIGPDGLGRVPQETVDCLQEVGQWTRRCAKALYGTEATPFPLSFPWGGVTLKEKNLYLLLTGKQTKNIQLGGIMSQPKSVSLLGYPEAKVEIGWSENVLSLTLPHNPEPLVPVIELSFDRQPELDTRLGQLPNDSIILPACLSQLDIQDNSLLSIDLDSMSEDKKIEIETRKKLYGDKRPHPWSMQIELGGFIQNWKSTRNSIHWEFQLDRPCTFEVWVSSVSSKYIPWKGGHRVSVEVDNQCCQGELLEEVAIQSPRSKYFPENACKIGSIHLKQTGCVKLKLTALEINEQLPEGLAVTEVKLLPL